MRLRPRHCPLLKIPHVRLLAFDVSETVVVAAANEAAFEIRVPGGLIRMRAKEVAHDEVAHLFAAARFADVNVVAARTLAGLSEEVVIGRIRIGREQVSEAFKRTNECLPLFDVAHRDLNIDDRLRGQIWHGGRADVFDPDEDIT